MKDYSFLRGAAILAGAGLITKLIGAFYRIPFARMVGEEGMGLYQMAYPMYTMILAFSTAGIPIAISILVSEKKAKGDGYGAQKILIVSFFMLLVLGLIASIGLYKVADFLAVNVLHDQRAYYSLVALAPALLLASMMSAFRGYFQGLQLMIPIAFSQVVEQGVRVSTVFIAGTILLQSGIEFAAAGATFGATTGSLVGLIVLTGYYFWWKLKKQAYFKKTRIRQERTAEIAWKILILAIPISLGGLVMPLMQTIDAAMVPLRLQMAGYDVSRATSLFGQFSGMAATLINLPTIVTISLSASLVPAISDALAKSQHSLIIARLKEALRLTVMLCLPASVGLFLMATPIAVLLYDISEVGISIKALAPAALFLGLHQTTAGAIQGLGKTYIPVLHLMIGATVKVICNYLLIPVMGIVGAGIGTVAGFIVAAGLNYLYLIKFSGSSLNIANVLLKPIFAATIMAITISKVHPLIYTFYNQGITTGLTIFLGMLVYGVVLMIIGGIQREDIEILPKIGPGLARILAKLKLVR